MSNTAIKLLTGGAVTANGGGGKGPGGLISCVAGIPCGDGEGGGSGGAILLEAPTIDIPASTGLYVNGGSGSCSLAGYGRDGTASLTPAPGEACNGQTGNGGAGGAGATNALDGVSKLGDNSVGGGGGGGRGRIRINLPSSVTFSPAGDTSGVLSVGVLATR